MSHRPKRLLLVLSLLPLLFAGCDSSLFSDAQGPYTGTLRQKKSGRVAYTMVSAEVTAASDHELELKEQARDDSGQKSTFILKQESNGKVHLTLSDWGTDLILKETSENCFKGSSSDIGVSATVCFSGIDLLLDLNWEKSGDSFTLPLTRFKGTGQPTMEPPQSYTMSELTNRAMDRNFESIGQFHSVLEAKAVTATAFANLLPTININTVLNVAGLTILNDLKAVGDLVPFLFPTRWLKAFEARDHSEAEFDGWILSKANSANVVQGLTYSLVRDGLVVLTAQEEAKSIQQIMNQVIQRERGGLMQAGSSDDVGTVLDAVTEGLRALTSGLTDEKAAVAQAAGFFNPTAITDVRFTDEVPIEGIKPYDKETIKQMSALALDRSYERRQLEVLKKSAHLEEIASYFQWMDPSGDKDGNFGINLIFYGKSKKMKKLKIQDKLDDVTSQILKSVARATNKANEQIDQYALARSELDRQTRRVQRHLTNLKTGINFSMSDLTNALREKLQAKIKLLHAQFAFLTIRGNLDRALLGGLYAGLPTDKADPSWTLDKDTHTQRSRP